ncbi:dynamin family protein [Romeria aff. gracilis LEGE 07310]|uniref:Dynamin family protein n=1 Tax=Vasconcelosia minhoensis LEGE 07310 TaxID=915328 RepID=A0A8J7AAC1_9CYAN|nr:dynamin family protein [Romeria gracilis]MBE9075884.1 dynamin family protein [Romeria aff. gracilis LEGE 07310]
METSAKVVLYDLSLLRQQFLETLDHFSSLVQAEKIRDALGNQLLRQLRGQANQIQERLSSNFSLVVIGDFKRGKSTLINALLGQPIVTTNVTPETITINQIQYGPEDKIVICLADGGQVSLEPEELSAEKLAPLIEQLSEVSHLRIEAPIEWLQGLCLVDTPGTGDIFKQFDRQVHDYLTKADAVLFVVSTLSPLSSSEQDFLRASLLPQDFPKVFFLANMMDFARSDREAERSLTAIQAKVSHLFPNARTFGLSALDEFCCLRSLPRPNPDRASALEAQFKAFRDGLEDSILLNRDLIQLDRAGDRLEQMLTAFEAHIRLLQKALQTDQLRLSQAIAQYENQSSELYDQIGQHQQAMSMEISQISQQACSWMKEFVTRLETEAIAAIPSFKPDDLQRHYHFFLTDSIRNAINQCLNTHRPTFLESADRAKKAIVQDLQLTDIGQSGAEVAQATFGDLPWTNLDTFQLIMDYTPLKLFADLFSHQARDSGSTQQATAFQKRLEAALPELRASTIQEVRSLYSNIANQLEKQVESIYQQEIDASLSALRQAQELSTQGEKKRASTDEGLKNALLLLGDTRSFLKSFKQKLWSEDRLEEVSSQCR